jgi:hypothetical protein
MGAEENRIDDSSSSVPLLLEQPIRDHLRKNKIPHHSQGGASQIPIRLSMNQNLPENTKSTIRRYRLPRNPSLLFAALVVSGSCYRSNMSA